jgi:hypothetical protein
MLVRRIVGMATSAPTAAAIAPAAGRVSQNGQPSLVDSSAAA